MLIELVLNERFDRNDEDLMERDAKGYHNLIDVLRYLGIKVSINRKISLGNLYFLFRNFLSDYYVSLKKIHLS